MFDRGRLSGNAWARCPRALSACSFLLALFLILFLPKASYGQKPLVLGDARDVHQVAFSPNSQFLAVSCWNCTVYIWDLTVQKPPHVLAADQTRGRLMGFTPDGKQLVTIGDTERGLIVKRWETETGKLAHEREIKQRQVAGCFGLSPDCKMVVGYDLTDNERKTVLVFDLKSGQKLLSLELSGIPAAVFSPDNRLLLTAFNAGKQPEKDGKVTATIRFTRLEDGKKLTEYQAPFRVERLTFSRDGKSLAASGRGLKIWDWRHKRWRVESQLWGGGSYVALSSDGQILACYKWVWHLPTKQLLLEVKDGICGPLALSPDGKKLAVEVGRVLHVYDLPSVPVREPKRPGRE